MSVIYEPKGKGNEESGLCVNLYRGCGHGCVYCYAPSALYLKRPVFFNEVTPRENVLSQLKKDAQDLHNRRDTNRLVLLSLSCDSYQPLDVEHKLTREAIKILLHYGLPIRILTKGGMRAARDFDLLVRDPRSEFGCTMTNDEDRASRAWEPNAALPDDRMEALQTAHEMGIKTWVSMEPVVDPEVVYRLIDQMKNYVRIFKIGKLNYHPRAKQINWARFRTRVVEYCRALGVAYFIKTDLVDIKPRLAPELVGDPRTP